MIKNKVRYCDRCKKEMPSVLDLSQVGINPHDILSLGFKTKTGRTLNKNYDLCQDCMTAVEEVLNEKVN
jgi:hypothetical protein